MTLFILFFYLKIKICHAVRDISINKIIVLYWTSCGFTSERKRDVSEHECSSSVMSFGFERFYRYFFLLTFCSNTNKFYNITILFSTYSIVFVWSLFLVFFIWNQVGRIIQGEYLITINFVCVSIFFLLK